MSLILRSAKMLHRFFFLLAAGCPAVYLSAQDRLNTLLVEDNHGRINFVVADSSAGEPNALLAKWKLTSGVKSVQWDYRLVFYGAPNDAEYGKQWSLPRIGMEEAWNQTTGGLTASGDTIVVAIIDRGFDIQHPDLLPNLWINHGEIPGDGIDNDGNGFADDYHGWNFTEDSPEFPEDDHGTSVAGIIGATGNNGMGISGINQRVKCMLFRTERVSEVIKAYQYIIRQRELYTATNGKQGAMVVVVNASFGVPGVFCREQAVWGGMIEQLGRTGILTVAATGNEAVDIDAFGDMPATCTSPFLLAVMATDPNDSRMATSAYGKQSVDLGAPGVQIFTTKPGNGFGYFSGTSAAAPHVSGAVALLYSLPCANFGQMISVFPQQAALAVKQAIVEGAAQFAQLDPYCARGGRLSVSRSMDALLQTCGTANKGTPLTVERIFPNPADGEGMVVQYRADDEVPLRWEISNSLGQVLKSQPLPTPNTWTDKQLYIGLDGLPDGVYCLSLVSSGAAGRQWFVKQ